MNNDKLKKEQFLLEIALVIATLGLTCLLYQMQSYKMVILNLFFLPVILSGFYLGRYRAGITSLFCFVSASIVISSRIDTVEIYASPAITALAVTAWGAVLGLTSILIGTLSDESRAQMLELHDAYVGVVEVLSRYLQSAHPKLKARSVRAAEVSQLVAREMKMSAKEIDDIRVAALLFDVGNIEITTNVIQKAVGALEGESDTEAEQTIQGMDLVLSLGTVLSGAIPLLLNQDESMKEAADKSESNPKDMPLGARIIRTVRAFNLLTEGQLGESPRSASDAIEELAQVNTHDPAVLAALRTVTSTPRALPAEELLTIG